MSENDDKLIDSADDFEQAAMESTAEEYILKLYISGMTPRSIEAISNIQKVCEQHLKGRYNLDVIDIYKHPEQAIADQIIATPTLVKRLPLPLRNLVGTLSNEERVLVGLNLVKRV